MSRFEGKTEKATPRKKTKARREGQNARSQEVAVGLSLAGAVITGRMFVPGAFTAMSDGMRDLFSVSGSQPTGAVLRDFALGMVTASVIPILAVAVVMAIAGGLLQSGFTLAPLALKPKFSHLNPSKGLQRFKPSTMWWEGARATLKLGLLALVVHGPINEARNRMGEAQGLAWWLDFLGDQAYAILLRAAILAVTIAAIDFAFNKHKHIKQMKMSKQEVKQEHKDMEGDPHVKGARRRRAQEMSRNRMISNVATADVVITNPTHYAVALKYQMGEPAPRVVAKGMGRMALKIRKEAYRNGVLVKQDPPLARAIYRTCKVGAFVPSALYEAVAVVLAAAFRLRRRRAA